MAEIECRELVKRYGRKIALNGINLGVHEGGYTSFSFDITDYIVEGENELKVKVRADIRKH